MNNTESLWPEIELESGVSPKSILAEQGNILGEMTKNILKARIFNVQSTEQKAMVFLFTIVAPALNNYQYDLFDIRYNLLNMYPIKLKFLGETSIYSNENEFKEGIQQIFSHPKTVQVIKALYAQSVDP